MTRNLNWCGVGTNSWAAFERIADGWYWFALIHLSFAAVVAFCQIKSERKKRDRKLPHPKTNSTAYLVTDNPYQAPQQS